MPAGGLCLREPMRENYVSFNCHQQPLFVRNGMVRGPSVATLIRNAHGVKEKYYSSLSRYEAMIREFDYRLSEQSRTGRKNRTPMPNLATK